MRAADHHRTDSHGLGLAEVQATLAASRCCELAHRISELSIQCWGSERTVEIVGLSPVLETQLARLEKTARFREPVLILGESGVGKELFAQALYLLSPRVHRPFVAVNCPQHGEGNLTVSELFGHRKGSFSGAVADHKGYFETASGGALFLDEIADLHISAQVVLLRALSTGAFQPLGSTESKKLDVRLIAATNRPLNQMVAENRFRRDLLFRLRYFTVEIPPLRDRGDDWRLLIDHFLDQLEQRYGTAKRFSAESLRQLEGYSWPGNVRELVGLVTTAYALSDGAIIEPHDFLDRLGAAPLGTREHIDELFRRLQLPDGNFWELVAKPFLLRDLNRSEVRQVVTRGLRETRGSYRQLLELWQMPGDQYQKFMDFLRHHGLKQRSTRESTPALGLDHRLSAD
jgi:transcriptional regulator with GAF, ATPase, and Fis domain